MSASADWYLPRIPVLDPYGGRPLTLDRVRELVALGTLRPFHAVGRFDVGVRRADEFPELAALFEEFAIESGIEAPHPAEIVEELRRLVGPELPVSPHIPTLAKRGAQPPRLKDLLPPRPASLDVGGTPSQVVSQVLRQQVARTTRISGAEAQAIREAAHAEGIGASPRPTSAGAPTQLLSPPPATRAQHDGTVLLKRDLWRLPSTEMYQDHQGPLGVDTLIELIEQGLLDPDTVISKIGGTAAPAGRFPELGETFAQLYPDYQPPKPAPAYAWDQTGEEHANDPEDDPETARIVAERLAVISERKALKAAAEVARGGSAVSMKMAHNGAFSGASENTLWKSLVLGAQAAAVVVGFRLLGVGLAWLMPLVEGLLSVNPLWWLPGHAIGISTGQLSIGLLAPSLLQVISLGLLSSMLWGWLATKSAGGVWTLNAALSSAIGVFGLYSLTFNLTFARDRTFIALDWAPPTLAASLLLGLIFGVTMFLAERVRTRGEVEFTSFEIPMETVQQVGLVAALVAMGVSAYLDVDLYQRQGARAAKLTAEFKNRALVLMDVKATSESDKILVSGQVVNLLDRPQRVWAIVLTVKDQTGRSRRVGVYLNRKLFLPKVVGNEAQPYAPPSPSELSATLKEPKSWLQPRETHTFLLTFPSLSLENPTATADLVAGVVAIESEVSEAGLPLSSPAVTDAVRSALESVR